MTPPPRVLVVDDEENIAYVVSVALRQAGLEVRTAATGEEALAVAADHDPHLLVLDVMLPDLDGFEVCRHLRERGSSVGVLFLTARDATEERLRGLGIGGDDYLTKPFSMDELVARAKVVLRRVGAVAESAVLRCGDLELDDGAHRVTKAGREVTLSPTEFKLLRFLLRNAGRIVTREQIRDHVWDYDVDGESTVVETFMSSLRRKVDSGDPRLIATVRSVGYRLGAAP